MAKRVVVRKLIWSWSPSTTIEQFHASCFHFKELEGQSISIEREVTSRRFLSLDPGVIATIRKAEQFVKRGLVSNFEITFTEEQSLFPHEKIKRHWSVKNGLNNLEGELSFFWKGPAFPWSDWVGSIIRIQRFKSWKTLKKRDRPILFQSWQRGFLGEMSQADRIPQSISDIPGNSMNFQASISGYGHFIRYDNGLYLFKGHIPSRTPAFYYHKRSRQYVLLPEE